MVAQEKSNCKEEQSLRKGTITDIGTEVLPIRIPQNHYTGSHNIFTQDLLPWAESKMPSLMKKGNISYDTENIELSVLM